MTRAVGVTELPRRRGGEAAGALARGFHDDPAFRDLWPDPRRRARALAHLLAASVVDGLRHGHVDAVVEGDAVVAAAVWFPPGA